jgi:hypothetical protein
MHATIYPLSFALIGRHDWEVGMSWFMPCTA